jgi:hypothetical protein
VLPAASASTTFLCGTKIPQANAISISNVEFDHETYSGFTAVAILSVANLRTVNAEESRAGQYIAGAFSSSLNLTPNSPGFCEKNNLDARAAATARSRTIFRHLAALLRAHDLYLRDYGPSGADFK